MRGMALQSGSNIYYESDNTVEEEHGLQRILMAWFDIDSHIAVFTSWYKTQADNEDEY